MEYSVRELADLAQISVRTLHYYDSEGLLKPKRGANGYRLYGETELLRLQQILFYKELEFSLTEISRILSRPNFDVRVALTEQRALITAKHQRLTSLLATIDQTLNKLNGTASMSDKDLYVGLTKEEEKTYGDEAEARWGHTEAHRQSVNRYGRLSAVEKQAIGRAGQELLKELASHMQEPPESEIVQGLIARHYEGLRVFYDPSIQLYRGLAEMYVSDSRFIRYFDSVSPGLAPFLRQAMLAYCERHE